MLLHLLFLILSAIIGRSDSFKVIIRPPFTPLYLLKGAKASISCAASHVDQDLISATWFKNAVQLPPSEFGMVSLSDIQLSDSGNYTCAMTYEGEEKRGNIEVIVYELPTFEETEIIQYPLLHKDYVITCKVKSILEPTIRWKKSGVPIRRGTKYSFEGDGLLVKNITEEDGGWYECMAVLDDVAVTQSVNIDAQVRDPPHIWSSKGVVRAIDGSTASITCSARGIPTPTFKFYKDGDKTPLQATKTTNIDDLIGKIWWHNVSLKDAGNYTCEAVNEVGNDSKLNKLIVSAPPKITDFENGTFHASKGYRVNCTATGFPTPYLTLFRTSDNSDTLLTSSSGKEGESVTSVEYEEKGSVDITKYSGDFVCVANNSLGEIKKRAYVDLLYPPIFSIQPPSTQYILVNYSMNVTCQALSNPPPTFFWTKNGLKIEIGDTFEIFNESKGHSHKSILQITPSSDESGDYAYRVTNTLGNKEGSFKVKEAVVPEEPKILEIHEKFPTSIILDVFDGEDGGSQVSKYSIRYNAQGSSESHAVEVEKVHKGPKDEPSTIKIENLTSSTDYEFHVAGVNLVGVGKSSTTSGRTQDASVPHRVVVESEKLACFEHQKVIIKWNEPDSGGARVEKYRVMYREVTSSAPKQWVTKETTKTEYKLEGLTPSSKYEIHVAAKNIIGWSLDSDLLELHVCKDTNHVQPSVSKKTDEGAAQLSSTGWLLGIIFALVVVVCIVVDLACYAANGCGVTKLICNKINSRKHQKKEYGDKANKEEREFLNMEGRKANIEKQPTQV